jgi:UDP-N-acetylmuramate-alanine ligase
MIDSRVKHENDMIQSDINEFEKVIYTEAIPENNLELKKAREL